jgi:hypothetical protein
MKRTIIICVVFIITNFLAKAQSTTDESPVKAFSDSSISKANLQKTVAYLSSDSLQGRLTDSPGATKAANYIIKEFKDMGLTMVEGFEGYCQIFKKLTAKKTVTVVNILGALPPLVPNDSVVIISAHYDHVGMGSDFWYNRGYSNADSIFNGANDNATGVAVMLELARYYSRFHNNKYTLLFVAFSGEEFGMLGSTELRYRLQDNIIKGMINLEMLGRPENKQCIIIGNDEDKIADALNSVLPDKKARYPYFVADPWILESLLTRSDHYPFLSNTDFCFTIMGTPPDDRFYHTVDDEYKTIDFKEMQKIALRILNGTAPFINTLPRNGRHYNL